MNFESIELFAEHLLTFVKKYSISKKFVTIDLRYARHSPLDTSLRVVVLHYLKTLNIEVRNIFNSLLEHEDLNDHFEKFSRDMVQVMCLRGYNERDLLQFCIILTMLAVLCYNHDFKDCLQPAITAIVDVLSFFKLRGDFPPQGWKEIQTSLLL